MTVTDYQQQQTNLESVKYLDTIKKRDEIFQQIKDLKGKFNTKLVPVDEIIQERKNIFSDLELLHNEVKLRENNLNNLKKLKDEFNIMKDAKLLELKTDNLGKIKDIELRKRKYQLIKYQNFLNEETIHLLWILLVILIVCCLLILGSLVKKIGFNHVTVLGLIFSSLGIYGVYLFKVLFVDNVNIDIYNIDMHEYEKVNQNELSRDKGLQDKLFALRAQSKGNNCNNEGNFDYQDLEGVENSELKAVENDMKSDKTDETCLRLTKS